MFKSVIIQKVEIADASALPSMMILPKGECQIENLQMFTEFNIKGLVSATVKDELSNNQLVYTTTVEFNTCIKTTEGMRRKAFLLTAADGTRYLVGTGSRPYPVITESNPFPHRPTESMLKKVTVKWTAPHPMLRII